MRPKKIVFTLLFLVIIYKIKKINNKIEENIIIEESVKQRNFWIKIPNPKKQAMRIIGYFNTSIYKSVTL